MPQRYLLSQIAENQDITDPFALPLFKPTKAQERELRRIIRRLLTEWRAAINETALPAYQRIASFGEVGEIGFGFGGEQAVAQLEASLGQATARTSVYAAGLSAPVQQHFSQMAKWHQAQFINSIRAATGVNVAPLVSLTEAEKTIAIATRRNVSLIKGLNSEIAKKVEGAVYDAFEGRFPIKQLRKRLTDDLGFAAGRAKVIATDQIGKYTASLDRMRHEEAGIEKYVWIETFEAKVPRPEHVARHQKVFSWDDPPHDGHPGEAIQCHCRALAFVEPGSG